MNKAEILCAVDMWVRERMSSVKSHSAFIEDGILHISLCGKKGIKSDFIQNEMKLSRIMLNKMVYHMPILFFYDGKPETKTTQPKDHKVAVDTNPILIHLRNYLGSFSSSDHQLKFDFTPRLFLKIDLREFPEDKAFKCARSLLSDFNSGHIALAPFPHIQISYFCSGTLINDWVKRQKAA